MKAASPPDPLVHGFCRRCNKPTTAKVIVGECNQCGLAGPYPFPWTGGEVSGV